MAERRLQQVAMPGALAVQLETVGQVDARLKAWGIVPETAVMTHSFVCEWHDVWVYRYSDASFALVLPYATLQTRRLRPADLGMEDMVHGRE